MPEMKKKISEIKGEGRKKARKITKINLIMGSLNMGRLQGRGPTFT